MPKEDENTLINSGWGRGGAVCDSLSREASCAPLQGHPCHRAGDLHYHHSLPYYPALGSLSSCDGWNEKWPPYSDVFECLVPGWFFLGEIMEPLGGGTMLEEVCCVAATRPWESRASPFPVQPLCAPWVVEHVISQLPALWSLSGLPRHFGLSL